MVYGYARISTPKQKIQRQIDNIRTAYPDASIRTESYTGTKIERPVFSRLIKVLKKGDILVVDEISRFSRNAEEGFALYEQLYNAGISLVSLKEPYINTDVYRDALNKRIDATGEEITDVMIEAINKILMLLARKQIQLAFETAQSEIDYLHKRTSEGVRKAQENGKRVGIEKGRALTTKKSVAAKKFILKRSKYFGGDLNDKECMALAKVSPNTFYKYKRELAIVEVESKPGR